MNVLCSLSIRLSLLAIATTPLTFADDAPQTRTFHFHYDGIINELPQDASIRVWLPLPQVNDSQTVEVLKKEMPQGCRITEDSEYGNRILYFESSGRPDGSLNFATTYLISRKEVRGLSDNLSPVKLTKEQRTRFLSADSRVPLKGPQLKLLDGLEFPGDSLSVARTLYHRVDDHVRYDKSQPGYGNGDVAWVCDSRFGNCTDFHSLFISWARAKGLPARFEIGFPLPPERGEGSVSGYHCWALFLDEKDRWIPVDISEADKHPELKEYFFGNLTENRIGFTTGRDITLVPKQNGPPLNYFVYPHVEVDGKPWARERIQTSFSYRDLTDKSADND